MRFRDLKLRLTATLGCSTLLLAGYWSGGVAVHPVATGETGSHRPDCPGGTLRGEGASSQRAAMEKLIRDYTVAYPGTAIDYTTSSSGAGVKAFFSGAVDLAGSDSPLSRKERDGVIEADRAEERCRENTAPDLPMVLGPIVVAHSVEGVPDLNLTAELIAWIFTGDITRWNDPAIAVTNPGVSLPDAGIAVFHRADESGTTENFTKYLAKTAGDTWGHGALKKWPAPRGEGEGKAAGVADVVADTRNPVTYPEWGAALERGLKLARIDGVELSGETAGRAVAAAGAEADDDDTRLDIDYTPGGGAYPLAMATYKVVCSTGGSNPELLHDFLGLFTSETVQASLEELGYAPLPGKLQKKVSRSVSGIRRATTNTPHPETENPFSPPSPMS